MLQRRDGNLPYPDGTIIARLAWSYDPLAKSGSSKYASTDGWEFAQFDDGKPADTAMRSACYPCHQIVKSRDFVFNHYLP